MFMYLFTILNDKNLNVLVLSGGLFYSNNISFWLTKIAFQLVSPTPVEFQNSVFITKHFLTLHNYLLTVISNYYSEFH